MRKYLKVMDLMHWMLPLLGSYLLNCRVTGADIPTPYAANLEAFAFPKSDDIIKSVKRMLGE